MDFLIAILTLALLALVVAVVGAPLRRARKLRVAGAAAPEDARQPRSETPAAVAARDTRRRDELEAAREAKYREIRDAELDYRTGKLSREDYQAIDADLRAEAIEILNRLEELSAERGSRPRDA
ncbi:MAG: hypothetical protein ABSG93_20275 [Solirubrobacteraceae bacterium]